MSLAIDGLSASGSPAEALSPSRSTANRPRVAYIVRREGFSSVFASQVVGRMGALSETGCHVEIGVFAPLGLWLRGELRARWRATVDSVHPSLAGRLWRLPSFPSRIDWPAAESEVLKWWLRRSFARSPRPVILQCRNATVTRMAHRAARGMQHARVIFDCRGVQDHELLYNHGVTFETAPSALRAKAERLSAEQALAARDADAVFCVSEAMADYLVAQCGLERAKCVVVPSCVSIPRSENDNDGVAGLRALMRRELELGNRLVVAYCGGGARWQLPDESLALFRAIRKYFPEAHFLVVTTQGDAMRRAAGRAGVPGDAMTIVCVPHAQVPAYLSAADVGLLLREPSLVNRVASPVKYAEYLASGTPVILSDGIGDFSMLTQRERVGLVLPFHAGAVERDSLVRQFLETYWARPRNWRDRCREVAVERLSWGAHLEKIVALYEKLSVERGG